LENVVNNIRPWFNSNYYLADKLEIWLIKKANLLELPNHRILFSMKNRLTILAILFSLLIPIFTTAQSLQERVEQSDLVIEGKVIAQESFWDNAHKGIYTKNQIEIFKLFKGNDVDTIFLITRGGVIGDEFQIVSHAIELNLFEEGIFFCKSYNIPSLENENIILNGINGYVKYHFDADGFKAADRQSVYSNIKDDLFEPIKSFGNTNVIYKNKNSLEKKIENWLEQTLSFSLTFIFRIVQMLLEVRL